MLSYREECFDAIGLKPSIKIPLFNGSLECEFRKYQMFEGKLREFRSEGGIVKSDEEKKAMAEKRRFKQNREFKKRLDEDEENEEADIRSFKFHKHHPAFKEPRSLGQDHDFSDADRPTGRDRRAARARGEFKKDRRGNDRDFRGGNDRDSRGGKGSFKGGRRDSRGGKGDFKGGKRGDFKRGGRDFKNSNHDFSDED